MSDPPGIRSSNKGTDHTGSPSIHHQHRSRLTGSLLEPMTINQNEYDCRSSSNTNTVTTPTGSIEIVHSSEKSFGLNHSNPTSDEENTTTTTTTRSTTYSNTNPDLFLITDNNNNQENECMVDSTTMRIPPHLLTSPTTISKSKLDSKSPPPTSLFGLGGGGGGGTTVSSSQSSPLMNTTTTTTNHHSQISSPRLQLPLPPPVVGISTTVPLSDGMNRPTTTSGTPNTATTTTAAKSKPHFTPQQKAQKFSSLKKRKQQQQGQGGSSNALLNRLFCNVNSSTSTTGVSSYVISSNNSLVEDTDDHTRGDVDTNSHAHSPMRGSGDPISNVRQCAQNVDVSTCVKIGTSIIEDASESITLHDEEKVRADIQSTIRDTLDIVCTPNASAAAAAPSSSPPTYCSTTKVSAFLNGKDTTKTNSPVRYRKAIHSSSGEQPSDESIDSGGFTAAIPYGGTTQEVSDVRTSNVSWNQGGGYDGELAQEALSKPSQSLDQNIDVIPKTPQSTITKSRSTEDTTMMHTPIQQPSYNKPMKTPGGLVIPSPFTHGTGRGLFPNTFGTTVVSSSYLKSSSAPTVAKMSPMASARKITSLRKEAKLQQQHPIPIVYIPDMATTSSTSTTVATSTATTSEQLSPPSSQGHRSPDRVEKQRDSPILVRITSSLEDLETVPEVTTSKEFDDATTTTVGGTETEPRTMEDSRKNSMEDEIDETEFLPNHDSSTLISPSIEKQGQRSSRSPIRNEDRIASNSTSLDDLKVQYERKISEQKDRIALANRVAKMRLDEIERLESIMDTIKDRPSNTDEVTQLKDRLQQLQQEKKKDVERVRQEVQSQLEERNKEWIQEQSRYESMKEELVQVKKQLAEAEISARPMITLVASNEANDAEVERLKAALVDANMALVQKENDIRMKTNGEVAAIKQQLAACRKKLAISIASSEQINQSVEVQMSTETERLQLHEELVTVKEQLSKVTARLHQKEKELSIVNTSVKKSSVMSKSPTRTTTLTTPNRHTSPMTTPVRSGSKIRSRMSIPNESKSAIKQREDTNEMNEREKETLRAQIALLNAQAIETSQEHDRALMELRKANEVEITRTKSEMEHRIDHHKLMEQELKESLSAASSTERDELLEQIEILQAEKKLDQLSGLRDVQKREELLQRIATLEQRDKSLTKSHEHAVEQLRTKGEVEIQKLRNELQSQEELRFSREKELELSLAESYSFEKSALTQKCENLECQLESERSGAVLLRLKVSNFEKEMDALKQQHHLALESQKASTAEELHRLTNELSDRLALEEAMQITTNERDTFEEELQLMKVKNDQDNRQFTEKIEEMKRNHSHEKTVTTNDLLSKISKLENELNESSRNVDQASLQKYEELKASYDEQIAALTKGHADEIAQLRLEMQAVEEKYKVLVTESNTQFESFQKEAEGKIEELKEELGASEERFKNDLQLAEKNGNEENKKFLEHYEELKKLQEQHESRMKAADASHNKHFEDLLAQLDLVEAEQQQTTAAKDKAISEKDAIVDALGSQLAEAQRKITEAQNNRTIDLQAIEEGRKSCQALERQTQNLRNEVRDLKEMQKKFIKDAEIKKDKACEEAREEMIEKAEIQFQQANEHYVKLRKQYDESQDRTKKFDSELRLLRKKIEKITKDKESVEIDLKAEVAQMHAANAKIEAESAQKAKEYRHELERLLQTAKNFEAKAEEATSTSRSIQTTLATVVAEKQKLQQEYEEMKSVSEELMAIVEGGERREC